MWRGETQVEVMTTCGVKDTKRWLHKPSRHCNYTNGEVTRQAIAYGPRGGWILAPSQPRLTDPPIQTYPPPAPPPAGELCSGQPGPKAKAYPWIPEPIVAVVRAKDATPFGTIGSPLYPNQPSESKKRIPPTC